MGLEACHPLGSDIGSVCRARRKLQSVPDPQLDGSVREMEDDRSGLGHEDLVVGVSMLVIPVAYLLSRRQRFRDDASIPLSNPVVLKGESP